MTGDDNPLQVEYSQARVTVTVTCPNQEIIRQVRQWMIAEFPGNPIASEGGHPWPFRLRMVCEGVDEEKRFRAGIQKFQTSGV